MKHYLAIIISLGLPAAAFADTITAKVNGMVCGFCATGIEKTFKAQPEVKSVNVDLQSKLVTVSIKDGQTMDDARLKKLIANAGYTVVSVEHSK